MLPPAKVDQVKALLAEGLTDREVARRAGVGRTTVQRIWAQLLDKPKRKQQVYQPVPSTPEQYQRVRQQATAAMEEKLARKRAYLAMKRDR